MSQMCISSLRLWSAPQRQISRGSSHNMDLPGVSGQIQEGHKGPVTLQCCSQRAQGSPGRTALMFLRRQAFPFPKALQGS